MHEYERMLYYAKSPHSAALPKDWALICERFPLIVRRAQVSAMVGQHYRVVNNGAPRTGTNNAYRKRDTFAGAGRSVSLGASFEMCN